jgi:hypothetical protein
VYHFIKRQLSLEITFNSDMPDYQALQEFVAKHVASQRFTRTFVYAAEEKYDDFVEKRKTLHRGLTPGYGNHFGWWNGYLVFIARTQRDSPGIKQFKEQMTLTFMTRRREVVQGFIDRLVDHINRGQDREQVSMFVNSEGWWRHAARLPKRGLNTVFMPSNEAQRALNHIREFQGRREWYHSRGLPWHTGISAHRQAGYGQNVAGPCAGIRA